MKVGKILILAGAGVIIVAVAVVYLYTHEVEAPQANSSNPQTQNQTVPSNSTTPANEATVREKFSCDRMTDDVRDSDVFCRFPELYPDGELSAQTVSQFYNCGTERAYPICDNESSLENFRQEQMELARQYLE